MACGTTQSQYSAAETIGLAPHQSAISIKSRHPVLKLISDGHSQVLYEFATLARWINHDHSPNFPFVERSGNCRKSDV
jgi:hypothetical protein